MEENNGRINEVNPTMEDLQKENTQLKQYLQNAVEEIKKLSNGWVVQRINWLFKIVELDFSTEFKVKAIEEIENYLYPKEQKVEDNSKNE